MSWIVIETFDRHWPSICTDTDGRPLIFETEEEAQEEADDCQDAVIVEI